MGTQRLGRVMDVADLALTRVARRRVSDDVREALETAIRNGVLQPGQVLPAERELMATMGVGRPAVREALAALARLGLVAATAGGRTRVTTPTPKRLLEELGSVARHLTREPKGLDDFEGARIMFEVGLVRWAARHAAPGQRAALRTALDRNEAEIGHQARFTATDIAFHRVLAEMPGNAVLLALHEACVEWVILQRPPITDTANSNRLSHAGHAAVVAAIEARDEVAAMDAMQGHLEQAYRRTPALSDAPPPAARAARAGLPKARAPSGRTKATAGGDRLRRNGTTRPHGKQGHGKGSENGP